MFIKASLFANIFRRSDRTLPAGRTETALSEPFPVFSAKRTQMKMNVSEKSS